MPSPKNVAIIAAAGSRKTEAIIEAALADPDRKVLITTYTDENQRQITARIQGKCGGILPSHITITGWFTFLVNQAVRPYQNSVTGRVGHTKSLNFIGAKARGVSKSKLAYFFDRHGDIFRDGVSDFAFLANIKSDGKVINRLERIYDDIYIDEVQDLVGYDLDFLDLLLKSSIRITAVGDPRQHTFATNNGSRNKKYRGIGIIAWFEERHEICRLESRTTSYRCSQEICDFADDLYPDLPRTTSENPERPEHLGVFMITKSEALDYVKQYNPVVLRENKSTNTLGLSAINIGVSKGSTYDRVLVFPTSTVIKYMKTRDLTSFKSAPRLYVAATRARFSVAFVDLKS